MEQQTKRRHSLVRHIAKQTRPNKRLQLTALDASNCFAVCSCGVQVSRDCMPVTAPQLNRRPLGRSSPFRVPRQNSVGEIEAGSGAQSVGVSATHQPTALRPREPAMLQTDGRLARSATITSSPLPESPEPAAGCPRQGRPQQVVLLRERLRSGSSEP